MTGLESFLVGIVAAQYVLLLLLMVRVNRIQRDVEYLQDQPPLTIVLTGQPSYYENRHN